MKIPTQWTTEQELLTNTTPACGEEEIDVHEALVRVKQQQQQQEEEAAPQQQRIIHFASDVVVHEIPNREDFSSQERCSGWFQASEYQAMRSDCKLTVDLYRANMSMPESQYTMRGLEGRLEEASKERYQARYRATMAVLTEQHRQRLHNYHSDDRMADLYHAVTWRSQYAAHTKALTDQLEEQQQQQQTAIATTNTSSRPASPMSNALRHVIAIEREQETSSLEDMLPLQLSSSNAAAGFDINSFFSGLAVTA